MNVKNGALRRRIVNVSVTALLMACCLSGLGKEARAQYAAPTAVSRIAAVADSLYGIQLYHVDSSGFRWIQYSRSLGLWGFWDNKGNPNGVPVTQWDPMLVGVAWNDFLSLPPLARVNVFHEFTVNSSPPALWQGNIFRSASLFAQNPSYTWNYGIDFSPPPGMYPKSVFARVGLLNVWGTDTPAHHPYLPMSNGDITRYGPPASRLMERFWNGSSWGGASYGNAIDDGYPILLGPTSSVWGTDDDGGVGIVAVAQDLKRVMNLV